MTKRLPLALAVALAVTASGCISLEMNRLKKNLEREVEADGQAEIGRGTAMSFGWGTFATARTLGWVFAPGQTAPYRRLSRRVRRVKVAQYPVSGLVDLRGIGQPAILARYQAGGWLPLVTVRDSSEAVWVMYRERGRDPRLTDLLAVALSDEELVMTRVSGDLTGLVLDGVDLAQTEWLRETLSETGILTEEPGGDGGAAGPGDEPSIPHAPETETPAGGR